MLAVAGVLLGVVTGCSATASQASPDTATTAGHILAALSAADEAAFDRVFATSSATDDRSPKAAALEKLRPLAFVDDYLPYFKGVPQDMHTALVLRQQRGSPNVGPELANVKSTHADLAAFADWWLGS